MTSHRFIEAIRDLDLASRTGRIVRILPTFVEADGPNVPVGAICEIETRPTLGRSSVALAEVVSVLPNSVILAPFEDGPATYSGARVMATARVGRAPVGDAFSGRAIDALGRPIDGGPPVEAERWVSLSPIPTSPLSRATSSAALETGLKTIDGLLTIGVGQRVGIFAASGVGKTTLMTQLATQVQADRCIVCLVGERGREVESFWSRGVSRFAKRKMTLISATSDESAAMRVRAAEFALCLADYWRSQGEQVLLMLDSVTRLAMAMRQIGLAAGEPPTMRAYTPSVFAAIPRLVERCGALKTGGSITAFMTVLSETDEIDDPISELMKSLLDGHIVLSRALAEQGHFPAIDVPRSVSRLAFDLHSDERRGEVERAVGLLSTYDASRTLIETGMYSPGASAEIDRAIELRPALAGFMKQKPGERVPIQETCRALGAILAEGG